MDNYIGFGALIGFISGFIICFMCLNRLHEFTLIIYQLIFIAIVITSTIIGAVIAMQVWFYKNRNKISNE